MTGERESIALPRFVRQTGVLRPRSGQALASVPDGSPGVLDSFSGVSSPAVSTGDWYRLDLSFLVLTPFVGALATGDRRSETQARERRPDRVDHTGSAATYPEPLVGRRVHREFVTEPRRTEGGESEVHRAKGRGSAGPRRRGTPERSPAVTDLQWRGTGAGERALTVHSGGSREDRDPRSLDYRAATWTVLAPESEGHTERVPTASAEHSRRERDESDRGSRTDRRRVSHRRPDAYRVRNSPFVLRDHAPIRAADDATGPRSTSTGEGADGPGRRSQVEPSEPAVGPETVRAGEADRASASVAVPDIDAPVSVPVLRERVPVGGVVPDQEGGVDAGAVSGLRRPSTMTVLGTVDGTEPGPDGSSPGESRGSTTELDVGDATPTSRDDRADAGRPAVDGNPPRMRLQTTGSAGSEGRVRTGSPRAVAGGLQGLEPQREPRGVGGRDETSGRSDAAERADDRADSMTIDDVLSNSTGSDLDRAVDRLYSEVQRRMRIERERRGY